MALRPQVDGLLNAAEQVVKDGEGTPSALASSNDSSTGAEPIGAPKHGPGAAEIRRQRGVR